MNLVSKLHTLSHQLLHLGEDGSPIYATDFTRLNTEVLKLADGLFAVKGETPEEEAALCVALLMGYNATIYNHGDKEKKKQVLLDRATVILDLLPPTLVKCQLLLYCYGEVYDKELLDEAKAIIISWGGRTFTDEEKEMMELYNLFLLNLNEIE